MARVDDRGRKAREYGILAARCFLSRILSFSNSRVSCSKCLARVDTLESFFLWTYLGIDDCGAFIELFSAPKLMVIFLFALLPLPSVGTLWCSSGDFGSLNCPGLPISGCGLGIAPTV